MSSISLRNQGNQNNIPFKAWNPYKQTEQPNENSNRDEYVPNKENEHRIAKSIIKTSEYTSGAVIGTVFGAVYGAIAYFGINGAKYAANKLNVKRLDFANKINGNSQKGIAIGVGVATLGASMLKAYVNVTERIAKIENKR